MSAKIQSKEPLLNILSQLFYILNGNGHQMQAEFLDQLTRDLELGNIAKFVDDINSSEFWGGSGAVWEVELKGKDRRSFDNKLKELIVLMREGGFLGAMAKSVYKLIS
jgi:hypothetical protein